jgi:hypothetical protein
VRDPQLADVAWTGAVGARGGSFVAHPTRDAPTFRAIAALVARTSPGRPLAESLRASADAHLAQRTSGRSSPEYWLEWLQREASAGPPGKRARRPRGEDPALYTPTREGEPPPPAVGDAGTAARAFLASAGLVRPTGSDT